MTEHYAVKWIKTNAGEIDGLESHYIRSDVLAIIKGLDEGERIEVRK